MKQETWLVRVDLENGDIAYVGKSGLVDNKSDAIQYTDRSAATYVASYAMEQGLYGGAECSAEKG